MKVLMFGWEFPPHISGGLGTACYGLSKGLLHNEVEVRFVVPKMFGDEPGANNIRLISASEVVLNFHDSTYQDLWRKLTIIGVHAFLRPYFSPEEYTRINRFTKLNRTEMHESVFQ